MIILLSLSNSTFGSKNAVIIKLNLLPSSLKASTLVDARYFVKRISEIDFFSEIIGILSIEHSK